MRLRLAARQSDLARIQALTVGRVIRDRHPEVEIEYAFRESLGDRNQHDELWQLPQQGVFTQDFCDDLLHRRVDLVVHSWKDLPTEQRPGLRVAATLPRADVRDLVLVRWDRWEPAVARGQLRLLSSSPRRIHNLAACLPRLLPHRFDAIEFRAVRGNVPTRIAKLFREDVDGLVVAKAAIDRLLAAPEPELAAMQADLRRALRQTRWMLLPVSQNPAAAAQGALAIEVHDDHHELRALLATIDDRDTFATVAAERQVLAGYGGGCHQKIGVTILRRPFGDVMAIRGVTDAGQVLDDYRLVGVEPGPAPVPSAQTWPLGEGEHPWFTRRELPAALPELSAGRALWIAHATALPRGFAVGGDGVVWAADVETWRGLAGRGVWVHGTADGLGEDEPTGLDPMLEPPLTWTRLTHADGHAGEPMAQVATHALEPLTSHPDLRGKTHFYWETAASFARAVARFPAIAAGRHWCGPGETYRAIRAVLGPTGQLHVALNHADWRRTVAGRRTEHP